MGHKYQRAAEAIQCVEERTGEKFDLLPCPHCNHSANLTEPQRDPDTWGGYIWQIVCSSSHCRARVQIVADGYFQQITAELNPHIPPNELYSDRLTSLRAKWNRRVRAAA
jgi:hypothetical protein